MNEPYSFLNNQQSIAFVLERLSHCPKCSDWEKRFILNIKDYFDKGGFLSIKQKEILSKLWEKY